MVSILQKLKIFLIPKERAKKGSPGYLTNISFL